MKKKLLLAVTLVACLLFSLCGCGETAAPSLDRTELTVLVGTEEQLLLQNAGSEDVVWQSSDEKVAVVEAAGTGAYVKGVSEGTATVTVQVNGEEVGRCNVTVKESPLSVYLPDGPTGSLKNGRLVLVKNGKATVKALSDVALKGTVKWSSSDENIGIVEYQGLTAIVTAVARGECTITVECDGYRASFTLLVGKTDS